MQWRKRNRLENYDYSQNGYYFVTICVKDRRNVFGEIVGNEMRLNEYGKIVEQQWLWLKKQYEYIDLDVFIVMPNHFHGILIIDKVGTTLGLSLHHKDPLYLRQKNLLSKTICAFKTTSSSKIHDLGHKTFQWQRSFYDHIIRKQESLEKIQQYIIFNPQRWKFDKENLKN